MRSESTRVHTIAANAATFSPRTLSLPQDKYKQLVREWRLPTRAAETSAVVGPFFWHELVELDGEKHLRKYSQSTFPAHRHLASVQEAED